MFEITHSDSEILESYKDCEKAYKNGVYDFTFEGRYLIYHTPIRHMVDYIAIDMTTGLASSVITKRPGELYTTASFKRLIPHILYSVKYTGDRRYLDRFVDDPLDVIDSIFRIVLPNNGYNIREEQISLAKKMYIGFTEKQVALCEAEVGTGKTLSYLVAAIVAKRHNNKTYGQNLPVTITTSSIELQKALVEREIPNLSQMLLDYYIIDRPLTAVLRKGKEHFFCRYRYNDFLRNIKRYPEKYADTIETLESMRELRAGIDLDKYRISGTVKNRICVKGSCSGCGKKKNCEYNEFTQEMYHLPDLDFQVTNHNMYLMSQKTRTAEHPPLLRESCFVVVDEAHKFKEAAEDTFGERISEKDVERYVNSVKLLCTPDADREKYKECLKKLLAENHALFSSLRKNRHANDLDEDRGSIITLTTQQTGKLNRICALVDQIEKMKVKRNYGIAVTGSYLLTAIRTINKGSKSTIWLDTDENGLLSLCCTPKDVNNILRKQVWDKNISHVLTSGTISDGTDFEYFKAENGLDQIPNRLILESRTESPFDYANHTRLYIPQGMPLPDGTDEYYKAVAEKIYKIIAATNGHTAVLFTSYKTLNLVHELLADRLRAYDVICMTRSNKNAITDFKRSKNGILFASGSMWEGVDCVGDCLSSVIIVRLPFPMRSAIMEEKKDACASVGDFIDRYCTPNMLIRLRQGVGRLIRCESDTGVVSILDPRAASKAYSEKIRHALHKFPLARSESEIQDFMHSVKSNKYYMTAPESPNVPC